MENVPLSTSFTRQYSISIQKEVKVGGLWEMNDGVGVWAFLW